MWQGHLYTHTQLHTDSPAVRTHWPPFCKAEAPGTFAMCCPLPLLSGYYWVLLFWFNWVIGHVVLSGWSLFFINSAFSWLTLTVCLSLCLPLCPATKRPSSVSSLSGIVGRMMSSGDRGASSSSCTSVNTVCSDGERPASLSLSSSTSSVSLHEASHSSSSSSSSLPYGAVPAYIASSTPKRNGSDISLDLTPLVTPHGGGAYAARTAEGHSSHGHVADGTSVVVPVTPRQLSRLERVVMEIVETEQAYVRDLKNIVEVRTGLSCP